MLARQLPRDFRADAVRCAGDDDGFHRSPLLVELQ
jgi:hypothetical protein